MRTAIQELMDILDVNEKNFVSIIDSKITIAYHNVIKKQVEHLLEKEKEQIMNAYCDGAKGGANGSKGQHENGYVSIHMREKYYNQKYNKS